MWEGPRSIGPVLETTQRASRFSWPGSFAFDANQVPGSFDAIYLILSEMKFQLYC